MSPKPSFVKNMNTLACTAVGSQLHCVRLDSTGRICHCIRGADGNWSVWGRLFTQDFVSIDISAIGEELHILALSGEGIIFHAIRFENGEWQSISPLPDQGFGGSF